MRFAKDENLFLAAFNHLVPFPRTPLYRDLAAQGRLIYPRWWLHDDYHFGQVPFNPEAMTALAIEAGCNRARRAFYTWSSILKRSLSFRCNSATPRRAWAYWLLNVMLRRELPQKAGLPLGGAS
ncbi:MAG TPA: hypothetical protein VIO38_04720 [Rariglobus sp.]